MEKQLNINKMYRTGLIFWLYDSTSDGKNHWRKRRSEDRVSDETLIALGAKEVTHWEILLFDEINSLEATIASFRAHAVKVETVEELQFCQMVAEKIESCRLELSKVASGWFGEEVGACKEEK